MCVCVYFRYFSHLPHQIVWQIVLEGMIFIPVSAYAVRTRMHLECRISIFADSQLPCANRNLMSATLNG